MMRALIIAVGVFAVAATTNLTLPRVWAEKEVVTAAVSGEVVSVGADHKTVVIKQVKDAATGATAEVTVTVSAETKILKGATALMLSDLKAKDKVSIKYQEGTTTAATITVE